MGKSKPKVEVTEYFMSEHFGLCHAEPDALLSIIVKEKEAWIGEQTTIGAISINQSELFGGIKKEGGLLGTVYYLPGADDQVLPDDLAQKLGRANGLDCPGFRGIASLFFYGSGGRGFYWTAGSPFLPGVWAKVRRIIKRSDGSEQWYVEKSVVRRTIGESGPLVNLSDTFKYKTVVAADTTDYSSPSYDDSAWLSGPGHIGGSAPFPHAPNNSTPIGTAITNLGKIWLRKRITLEQASAVTFTLFHDEVGRFWVNGVEVPRNINGVYPSGQYWWSDTDPIILSAGVVDLALLATDSAPMPFASAGISAISQSVSSDDMNPAHIIHECLTDLQWGMGTPVAALDDDSFRAAADTLYDENFGLSMIWTRQASIQDFVQEILDHIQAVIYADPATGLLTLSLIRGDYDADTLDVINPDNADLSNFSRKLWGDIVNEIIVTWTNPENEQEETITVQDDASIAIQGGIVSDSRNYYGVRNAGLAQDLAYRDLRSAGQPLASCQAEVDRSEWQARPASVRKLTWPEYGLSGLVMRVQSIDYGKPGEPMIKLQLIEDVYGLDVGAYDQPPSTSWTDPSAAPAPVDPANVEIFTLPYFFSLGTTVAAFVDSPEYPEVISGVLATDDSEDTFAIELWDEITLSGGSTEWQQISNLNVIGRAELVSGLDAEALSAGVTFDNFIGQTVPEVSGFLIIGDDGEAGNEIALVTVADGDYDLTRGVLDTIPRAWPAGTLVWFVNDDTLYEDSLIRSAGELVDYKLLPRTSQGLLDLADASVESYTLTERPWLPNRPADVVAYGEAWSSELSPIDARLRPDPWVTVSWAIRNRLDEDTLILSWTDASATAEVGQTTTIEVRDIAGALLTTHDGLAGTTFDVPDASFSGEAIVELRIYSERTDDDGDFVSLQYFSHWVQIADGALILDDGSLLLTEGGDTVILEG
jgi:Putative phage tail protein